MANTIGKNIRRLRTDCHMTQDTLAERLFVSRQTVSNYETGKSNPDIDTLTKLAEIFETDVNTLIYGPPAPANKTEKIRRLCVLLGIALALTLASFLLLPYADRCCRLPGCSGASVSCLPCFFFAAQSPFPESISKSGTGFLRFSQPWFLCSWC